MPGWHARTRDLVKDGRLLVAGLAPEQHGDRMALFLQWKGMEDMPVMLDSYNLLGLKVVPTTLLIDEAGIIRHRNPSPQDLSDFLGAPRAEVGSAPPAPRLSPSWKGAAQRLADLESLMTRVPKSPEARPDAAAIHFQLGVAFRKRYDSSLRKDDDFSVAVEHWRRALEIDPSNYIWRRRLQQYGPRLDKPYPFYNWIDQAREEITARREKPRPLVAEPSGAELALPAGNSPSAAPPDETPHPDPDGKLPRETGALFSFSKTIVPHTTKPGTAARVFVETAPLPTHRAKWNDEAGLSSIRVVAPAGWTAHPAVLTLPPHGGPDPLHEARRVEFELRRDKDTPASDEPPVGTLQVFTHVCHGREGTCEFRRRDVPFTLPSTP